MFLSLLHCSLSLVPLPWLEEKAPGSRTDQGFLQTFFSLVQTISRKRAHACFFSLIEVLLSFVFSVTLAFLEFYSYNCASLGVPFQLVPTQEILPSC